jgi:hypothetical protein
MLLSSRVALGAVLACRRGLHHLLLLVRLLAQLCSIHLRLWLRMHDWL